MTSSLDRKLEASQRRLEEERKARPGAGGPTNGLTDTATTPRKVRLYDSIDIVPGTGIGAPPDDPAHAMGAQRNTPEAIPSGQVDDFTLDLKTGAIRATEPAILVEDCPDEEIFTATYEGKTIVSNPAEWHWPKTEQERDEVLKLAPCTRVILCPAGRPGEKVTVTVIEEAPVKLSPESGLDRAIAAWSKSLGQEFRRMGDGAGSEYSARLSHAAALRDRMARDRRYAEISTFLMRLSPTQTDKLVAALRREHPELWE